jgi:hypothetical protein
MRRMPHDPDCTVVFGVVHQRHAIARRAREPGGPRRHDARFAGMAFGRETIAHLATFLGWRAGTPHALTVVMAFKKILCAVDFSDPSRDAMRAAAELARTSQATLALVHVWQPPLWTTDYGIQLPNDALLEASGVEESKLASWRAEAQQLGASEVTSKLARGVPCPDTPPRTLARPLLPTLSRRSQS